MWALIIVGWYLRYMLNARYYDLEYSGAAKSFLEYLDSGDAIFGAFMIIAPSLLFAGVLAVLRWVIIGFKNSN